MFNKILNMPKSMLVFLAIFLTLGIGIFAAVCVTVWIAKRYGKKVENNKFDRKILQFKQCLAWLKVLIVKELDNMHCLFYCLKGSSINSTNNQMRTNYYMAIEKIIKDINSLQVDFLANFVGVDKLVFRGIYMEQQSIEKEKVDRSLCFMDDAVNEKILENYLCKFVLGYYQNLYTSMQQVALNTEVQELFTEEEKEYIKNLIDILQKITNQKCNNIKGEFLEIKKVFWTELKNFIEELHLEDSLQESIVSIQCL